MSRISSFDPKACERLFHGTLESLIGQVRPGGYDGVLWSAEHSTTAQNYIPATGGSVYVSVRSFEMDELVRPGKNSVIYDLAKLIGPAACDVQWDQYGQAKSWRAGTVTNRQVVEHIEKVLGYQDKNAEYGGRVDRMYELRTDGWDPVTKESNIVAADFKKQGSLIIIDGFQGMRFLDASLGESDLTELQYHRHDLFKRARDEGYDGVVIDDFCQSKTWGNMGHRSIGFLEHAAAKLITTTIPAVNFDWGGSSKDLSVTETPEYAQWRRAQAAINVVKAEQPASAQRFAVSTP